MRRLPTMLFYDWKDPLLEGCGEDGPHHRHPRPRQTPPCGRRANCPVIGRGAGRHAQSCEGRGCSPRRPQAEPSEQLFLREGSSFPVWTLNHPSSQCQEHAVSAELRV